MTKPQNITISVSVVIGSRFTDECVSRLTTQQIIQPMLFKLDGRYWVKTDNTAIPERHESCFDDCIELLFFTFLYSQFHTHRKEDDRLCSSR